MTTLNSTSILASIIAQNPYHIISIQGQMPMSHAQNTYDFEIAEDDPHYDDMVNYSGDMLWVYTYADKESLELDLMDILNQMDLLRGCDDQYFDYNVDEVDMVLYGATIIQEQEKYKPLIMENSNTTRITSMRKNMPRKSTITLTSSKNQKLFTLSPKILSVFSNPLSNENQTYNPNINCHGSSSHGIPY